MASGRRYFERAQGALFTCLAPLFSMWLALQASDRLIARAWLRAHGRTPWEHSEEVAKIRVTIIILVFVLFLIGAVRGFFVAGGKRETSVTATCTLCSVIVLIGLAGGGVAAVLLR